MGTDSRRRCGRDFAVRAVFFLPLFAGRSGPCSCSWGLLLVLSKLLAGKSSDHGGVFASRSDTRRSLSRLDCGGDRADADGWSAGHRLVRRDHETVTSMGILVSTRKRAAMLRREAESVNPGSFGLVLPNRAVVLGTIRAQELVDLTRAAEAAGSFDAVWAGDSLIAKPRLESITLLSALATVTTKIRLGVACMATFVHRHPVMLAHQWAGLDVLSEGRSWLVVCIGGPDSQGKAQALEHAAMGIDSADRAARLEEGITIVRRLLHERNVTHRGRFYEFEEVTIQPPPVQNPCPIWIASNPTGLTWKDGASAAPKAVERNYRRVVRYADGWMTNKLTPGEFQNEWTRIETMAHQEGISPARLGTALYHNIHIEEDRERALEASKIFLEKYYTTSFSPDFVEKWTIVGSPEQCIDELRSYFEAGVNHMALRLASWDQHDQLKRFIAEVAPAFSN
jgi:alkanesulfonate monooxygenase SsuD/methylene tetrahydromethanopterin reductase-like flavin-dependent oxidoreductase (luciferase family)